MEGVARWSHFRPHRGSGSGVVTGDGDEASGEGKKRAGGCSENRWRRLPFIGAVRR
jgi:hypothetical protein